MDLKYTLWSCKLLTSSVPQGIVLRLAYIREDDEKVNWERKQTVDETEERFLL